MKDDLYIVLEEIEAIFNMLKNDNDRRDFCIALGLGVNTALNIFEKMTLREPK